MMPNVRKVYCIEIIKTNTSILNSRIGYPVELNVAISVKLK